MLASLAAPNLHTQIHHCFIPLVLLPSFPPKGTYRRAVRKSSHKNFLKTSSKNASIPLQNEAIRSLECPVKDPSSNSSEWFRVSQLDPKTLPSLLTSCSHLTEVRCLHAVAVRLFDSSVTFVINNLICAYARFHELLHARKLFDRMPERNVVSWTAMLNGYLKAGLDDEVLKLFEEMVENNVKANSLTFVCLLKSCGNRMDYELGTQIHASVVKGNWSNLIMDSALVYFYAQCGDLLGASRMFDRMPNRDVISWTSMITAYAQNGHGEEAFLMFSQMQYYGFHPNEFTVCSVLKACGEVKALRFGKQLHGAIVKGMFKEDVYVGSSLVTMYVRCSEVNDARMIFDLMPKRNTITWTSMISGYSQRGLGKKAILLFQRMKERRVFANNLTIVSVLSACGSIGSLYLGKEVHGQIIKSYIQKNVHIGSTLIWFYCKCGEYAYAARVLEVMPARDVISWTAIISGYSSLGHSSEALGFLNDMLWEGLEPNPFTYSSALKACAKIEAMRHGQLIHASVSKTRALSNVFVGSALIDMYMRCGCTADALRVFDTMPERNLVSWKSMIIGYAKNGHCREALKLMYQMQEEGLYVDDFVHATVLGACGDIQWESKCSAPCCSLSS